MAFKDILLHLDSFPGGTPARTIDEAVSFAATLKGRVTALAVQVTIPLESNRLADYFIKLSDLAREQEALSAAACHDGLKHFEAAARAAGVFGGTLHEVTDLYSVDLRVAQRARTRDLCIVPLAERYDGQTEVAQAVIFGSGQPVLVFKVGAASLPKAGLGCVVVAWDGGRFAARALSDALPLLKLAHEVRVVTVVNEKPSAVAGLGAEAVRRLKVHGIAAVAEDIDAKGRLIGKVLDAYVTAKKADLLVMGAYGHSRMREMLLGGATEHALYYPKVALFLSH